MTHVPYICDGLVPPHVKELPFLPADVNATAR